MAGVHSLALPFDNPPIVSRNKSVEQLFLLIILHKMSLMLFTEIYLLKKLICIFSLEKIILLYNPLSINFL